MSVGNRVVDIMKKHEIDIIPILPCERIKTLISLLGADSSFHIISLNKEEDGVGICAGAYLGGGKPALVIQSSGLGNCFNALLSLSVAYELPIPVIASWRGIYEEKIPAQIPFNKDLPRALEAWKIPYLTVLERSQIDLLEEAIERAYEENTPFIVLISPKVWEKEDTNEVNQTFPPRKMEVNLQYRKSTREPEMTRYEAIKTIVKHLDEEIVISNIGVPSKELYHLRDRDLNFYMLGSYTQASSIGLGISLKVKRDVIVLDGDGSLLGSNVLPIIGIEKPENLSVICLDNGTFGSTGDQPTCAYSDIDMELVAISANIKLTYHAQTKRELESVMERIHEKDGPKFIHVLIKPGNARVKNIPLTPVEIKKRFMKAIS